MCRYRLGILLAILLGFACDTLAQPENYYTALRSGKAAFRKADYVRAIEYLQKAIEMSPEQPEAHYFLAYTYSRMNSGDGNSMLEMNRHYTELASKELETVIKLSPRYTGEIVVQDPYSKISSEWGALALKYIYDHKRDSVVWAFQEGRKRGGFSDFVLSVGSNMLQQCPKNAILFSSGDIYLFSLLYQQNVAGIRRDVTVVDMGLLQANWYPSLIARDLSFEHSAKEIKSLPEYSKVQDTLMKLGTIEWRVKTSSFPYVYRGATLFLSLMKKNYPKRAICFTQGMPEEYLLGLSSYLTTAILIDRLEKASDSNLGSAYYESETIKTLGTLASLNLNSDQEIIVANSMYTNIFCVIDILVSRKKKEAAKRILLELDKYVQGRQESIFAEDNMEYLEHLRQRLY